MPAEGGITNFKSVKETVKIPFVIHADLEALLHKLTVSQMQETEKDQTEELQKQVACSYGYKVVCCYDDELSKPFKMYRGVDSFNEFFGDKFEEEKEILERLKEFKNTPMKLSNEDQNNHKNAKDCYVCKCIFTVKNRKV